MKCTIQITLLLLSILYFFQSCQKVPGEFSQANSDQDLIRSAQLYFTQQLQPLVRPSTGNKRIDALKAPYWQGAYCVSSSKGPVVVVPLFYQKDLVVSTNFSGARILTLNSLTKLILYKDSSMYQAQVVTAFPDSTVKSPTNAKFSGTIFVETWQGQPLKKLKFTHDLILTAAAPSQDASTSPRRITASDGKTTDALIATCSTIYGYNYSPGGGGDVYYWAEPAGCDYQYIPDPIGPGPAPVSPGLAPIDYGQLPSPAGGVITIAITPPPTNIIANISDYVKCFSNYGGSDHTYQVMVCVDQPVAGSRQAWATSRTGIAGSSAGQNPVDAGHVFLVLAENFSGYSIVRNVGFYPATKVYPWASSAQGQLNNDDGHIFNISLTVNVDNGQFFNILNYISQGNDPGYMYDLNTNNCTSFAIHALAAGNIILPATVGTWLDGGFGYDPGDLGEDIRKMSPSQNMTRNVTYTDHPNQYTCN